MTVLSSFLASFQPFINAEMLIVSALICAFLVIEQKFSNSLLLLLFKSNAAYRLNVRWKNVIHLVSVVNYYGLKGNRVCTLDHFFN